MLNLPQVMRHVKKEALYQELFNANRFFVCSFEKSTIWNKIMMKKMNYNKNEIIITFDFKCLSFEE